VRDEEIPCVVCRLSPPIPCESCRSLRAVRRAAEPSKQMRRPASLFLLLLALPAASAPPALAAGGSEAGTATHESGAAQAPEGGGAVFGPKPPSPGKPPVLRVFHVTPGAHAGEPVTFALRLAGTARAVRLRVDVRRAGRLVKRLDAGSQPTGRAVYVKWATAGVPAGSYVAVVHAVDPKGQRLARTSRSSGKLAFRVLPAAAPKPAPTPAPIPTVPGRFPVQGPYSFGGEDARFGARRPGHSHQGQDITGAEGTPIVAPRAGVIEYRAYQASGAGHYLVLHGDGEARWYVFMHLKSGSLLPKVGDHVTAGQPLAQMGSTGESSGPHLHFEIWAGGWWTKGSAPIDPLPDLQRWAAGGA
jgi:murein DD-endopeptidase MepM/ murein hydrolase activator NlpD